MAGWVLVVDDDTGIRRGIARELCSDFEVLLAADFADAMRIFASRDDIEAVVSDFKLGPGPDGIALLDEVRRRAPTCIRILASGTQGAATEVAQTQTAHAFIEKPWRRGEILDALRRLMTGE